MTNSKMTKRALFTSIMALMLCFAMLTGTTFAWFTDQETSANNQIIAGNLDVELYHQGANDANAIKVDSTTDDLFQDVTPEKWEPGAIAYETFTVKNAGNLAFKYDLTMDVKNATVIDGESFADRLKIAVVKGEITSTGRIDTTQYTWTGFASFAKNGQLYPANYATDMTNYPTEDKYTVFVWWEPSDIDNTFNVKSGVSADFSIQLFATQLAAEKDAFDENYDKDAVVKVATADQLKEAVAAGKNVQFTADITMSEKLAITADTVIFGMGKTLTYTGADRAIDAYNDGDVDLTINDLTVNCSAGYCQRGINYNDSGDLVLNNVTIKGTNVTYALNLPGSSDNATVVINNSALTGNIALNVWGENATITANSTVFTSVDKNVAENYSAIALNSDGTSVANGTVIYVNGGKIIAHDEKGALSNAVRNGTTTGKVEISDSTEVIGNSNRPVAIVDYGTAQFYSSTTLQAAIDKAIATNGNVKLITNIVLDKPIVVDGTVAIDLNGYTITYNSTTQGEAMITNNGNLTINDTVGTGVINYNYTGAADPSYGKGNYTISNQGTLTVNGGKITIANLSGHAKYPIDNNSTTGDAVLVIKGGHLYNYNTSAIRQFCNSTTYKNSVTIKGGKIEGYCAIWMQNPGNNTVNSSLTVTGGEIKTTAKDYVNGTAKLEEVSSAIYCTIAGNGGAWSADSFVSITGGIINENVKFAEDAPENVTVEGATFNGYVEK